MAARTALSLLLALAGRADAAPQAATCKDLEQHTNCASPNPFSHPPLLGGRLG